MISSVAFVLFIGELVSSIYNFIISKMRIDHTVSNDFERRNVCKKTAYASFYKMITYGIVMIIAFILKK